MQQGATVESLLESLMSGDRQGARSVVFEKIRACGAESTVTELLWPCHETIEKLHRADQCTVLTYHLSTRLLRMMVDQTALHITQQPRNGRSVFALSGPTHGEELAAQMTCDLIEGAGYDVSFGGGFQILGDDTGGIPADEVMALVQDRRPDVLLMFSSAARDLPAIRSIIDRIREVGATPHTQVIVGGGVFTRAEGLSEEIGADICCGDPMELLEVLTDPAMQGVRSRRATSPVKKKVITTRRAA